MDDERGGSPQTGIDQGKVPSRKLGPGRSVRKRGASCQGDGGHDVQIWRAWTHRQPGPRYASGPQTRQNVDTVRDRSGEFPVNGSPRSPR